MSDKHNEQLSALIDGAEVDERVLERMLKDDEQLSTWQRYQLAGAIVRNEAKSGMPLDISAAVAAQVSEEPAIVAPRAKRSWLKPAANDSWWRPAASFAVAASVALVTVIGVHNYQVTPTGNPAMTSADASGTRDTNPVFETAPIGGMASPVSFNAVQSEPAVNTEQGSAQRRQLQSFFIDHQQQSQLGQQEQQNADADAAQHEQPENGNQ
ncbi:sigma-E factor negative regulatory protein [Aliidiomarina sp. Khilg15.8]